MTIEEIKKLRAEATPGKWKTGFSGSIWSKKIQIYVGEMDSAADSEFVAALPEIADECIRLAEENERLEKSLQDCEKALHEAIEEGRVRVEIPHGLVISRGDGEV